MDPEIGLRVALLWGVLIRDPPDAPKPFLCLRHLDECLEHLAPVPVQPAPVAPLGPREAFDLLVAGPEALFGGRPYIVDLVDPHVTVVQVTLRKTIDLDHALCRPRRILLQKFERLGLENKGGRLVPLYGGVKTKRGPQTSTMAFSFSAFLASLAHCFLCFSSFFLQPLLQ